MPSEKNSGLQIMKRKPKEIKLEIVDAILRGELLVKEAMSLYGVKYEKTIINWIKSFVSERQKMVQNKMNNEKL